MVATHEIHSVKFFRDEDHSKGEVNFLRSGGTMCEIEGVRTGRGSGVEKVR